MVISQLHIWSTSSQGWLARQVRITGTQLAASDHGASVQMANADFLRRKVTELKDQAARLGSDAVDSLRGSRIAANITPTFEELRDRARR